MPRYRPRTAPTDGFSPELPPMRRKRGRPRRNIRHLAQVTTLRIDPVAKQILEAHFKSIGDALFHLASFIYKFKSLPEVPLLSKKDLEFLMSLVNEKLDKFRGPDHVSAPWVQTLRCLEGMLESSPGAAGVPRKFLVSDQAEIAPTTDVPGPDQWKAVKRRG